MIKKVSRKDVEASLNCFDNLSESSGVLNEMGTIVKTLVSAYISQSFPEKPKDERFTVAEERYIYGGHKVQAIRLYRNRVDCGLIDAKHFVESHPFYKED